MIKAITFFYIKWHAKLSSVCRGAESHPLKWLLCDFQRNIYPSSAPKERAKLSVLCLNVYGRLRGVHTDDQSKNHQMHRCWDVGGENSPSSTPEQTGLPPDCSRRNLQPLVRPLHCPGEDPRWLRSEGPRYAELWAAAFPLDVLTTPSPHTQLPPGPGAAANAFVVFLEGRLQASSLYTRRDKQAHPATAGQPQFPLQPRFCYELWHTVVPCKKCSVSKNWF